ncbi:EF-hand domain-containing protein [uncultured Sphingomonas sp.]|uniref:EF-hand domain-containing protein n=1 Tax=uncultured Sphingomonas sp. TaxID=158754 RepID=UPI0035C99FB6
MGVDRLRLLIAVLIGLFVASPAMAQLDDKNRVPVKLPGKDAAPQATPPSLVVEPVAMMIATFDADGDGRVTRDELARGVRRSFAAIDTANSGTLGYIAFSDWALRWLGDRNALPSPYEVDTDGDDRITLSELEARFATIFVRLDKDRDEVLTRAELLTIRGDLRTGSPGNGKARR